MVTKTELHSIGVQSLLGLMVCNDVGNDSVRDGEATI